MAQVLRPLHDLEVTRHPDLIVGMHDADDAGVYRLAGGIHLVQTVDFFTPIVDDPFDWGRIAAANSLSDVYAMGGRPITALSIVGWPREELSLDLLADVQRGGAVILAEAGCTLVGGHSIDDREPKYGLAVTGVVEPDAMMTNGAARPGDRLVITKPIGTGLISTAIKRDKASPEQIAAATDVMVALNRTAAEIAGSYGVKAATDITGFGLLGHLGEMAAASGVGATIDHRRVPLLPGVVELAEAGIIPGGTGRNQAAAADFTTFGDVPDAYRTLLSDAQTSGGLLLAVSPERCDEVVAALGEAGSAAGEVIGEIVGGSGVTVI
ncbi:MAG: selenide, water dikinase SelD [Acidimicrobiia bacterium]|nr:selenide, water dikinase SelD [Acidimicrobiia bacterium]